MDSVYVCERENESLLLWNDTAVKMITQGGGGSIEQLLNKKKEIKSKKMRE